MSEAMPAQCPLPITTLAPNFQKHVDPAAPVSLRMMGAKAMVPMGPKDMVTALYMLSFDPDGAIREAAEKSATGLPDRILSVALRDETVDPPVLDYYATRALTGKDVYLEMVVLNPATPDETVRRVAATADEKIVEIVSQNQLRLLRYPDIVRALCDNKAARGSTIDSVCDFCVRSGLALDDLPQFKVAKKRILGVDDDAKADAIAAQLRAEETKAESELVKIGAQAELPEGVAPPTSMEAAAAMEAEEEKKRTSITQQMMKLSVAKKIEWANKKGNREVRNILLRDPNKLVQLAVIQSPRITEPEIAKVAFSRTAPMEVLSFIYNNRMLLKNYAIKVSLVNNPKVPVAVSMRFLSTLRATEVKALAKSKNVPAGLANAAKKMMEKKGDGH